MKIHLTHAKTLDGAFLPLSTEVVDAKSILGAMQEYSFRTGTKWRATNYGWYRQHEALAHLFLSETSNPVLPPLPKIRVFSMEEYMIENDKVDFTYVLTCKIFAFSEREAVGMLRQNTKKRNVRLNLPASSFINTYERGWMSKYIKLVVNEES